MSEETKKEQKKGILATLKEYKTKEGSTFKKSRIGTQKCGELIKLLREIRDNDTTLEITFGEGKYGEFISFRESTWKPDREWTQEAVQWSLYAHIAIKSVAGTHNFY